MYMSDTVRKKFDTIDNNEYLVVTTKEIGNTNIISIGENPTVIPDGIWFIPPDDFSRSGMIDFKFEEVEGPNVVVSRVVYDEIIEWVSGLDNLNQNTTVFESHSEWTNCVMEGDS